MATVIVRVRDTGIKIAGHLYLRLGVTIATAIIISIAGQSERVTVRVRVG